MKKTIFYCFFLLSIFVLLNFTISTLRPIINSPMWLRASNFPLQPSILFQKNEKILPLFYLIGAIPSEFEEKPILYEIFYKSGPPKHFIHQIEAHFEQPDIKLIFQGPKTPENLPNRDKIQSCLFKYITLDCLQVREITMENLMKDTEPFQPTRWTLHWFQVNDTTISKQDQSQGIYIQAIGKSKTLDRFVFINARGTHQSLSLVRPQTISGDHAYLEFLRWIGSYRVYNDLSPGQDSINRSLSEVQLENLAQITDPTQKLNRLFEIQTLLISKVSVDPNSLDSYFHLAGTSSLLLRGNTSSQYSWKSLAHANLKASFQYAQDIAPSHQKTAQIEALWLNTPEN